jgi:hypothetical protein
MNLNHRWILPSLAAIVLAAVMPVAASARALGVEIWTDRGDDAVYQPGEAMTVKVRASDEAYLVVYEIDSDGHINLLYPWRRGSNMVDAHRTYRLPPDDSGYELAVERSTGEGYIVAIASRRPFRDLPWYLRPYDPQAEGNGYEGREDEEDGFDRDGNVVGDPMVAMERIRRRVLDRPSDTDDFATSYSSYYVGHEVRYPRYLCADCHRAGQWAWWDGFDPYYTRCSVFDFRVNWNWCWGPCIWTGYQPYFFYCVRPDCPPRYTAWNHDRWSSWDGRQTWTNLWGNHLTRYKTPPPTGYVPPPSATPGGRPVRTPVDFRPPGYLPPLVDANRGGRGFRTPMPGGRVGTDGDVQRGSRGSDPPRRTPSGGDWGRPGARPAPSLRPPRDEEPRETPRTEQPRREPRQETPREQPRNDPPREQPRNDPPQRHEEPRREPEHRDPPARQEHHDDGGNRGGDRGNRGDRGGRNG